MIIASKKINYCPENNPDKSLDLLETRITDFLLGKFLNLGDFQEYIKLYQKAKRIAISLNNSLDFYYDGDHFCTDDLDLPYFTRDYTISLVGKDNVKGWGGLTIEISQNWLGQEDYNYIMTLITYYRERKNINKNKRTKYINSTLRKLYLLDKASYNEYINNKTPGGNPNIELTPEEKLNKLRYYLETSF
jgi:hypothetical protein